MKNIYEATAENKRKSFAIVFLFVIFTTTVIYVLGRAFSYWVGIDSGGFGFVGIALIVSGFMSLTSYYYSDRIVLSISKARPADKVSEANFYSACENMSIVSGLPMPKLYVIDDTAMNAFATGRDPNHAVIAATTGLINKLDKTEIEAVVAHEMSHIKNYDTRLMSIVAVMVGTIILVGDVYLRSGIRSQGDRRDNLGVILVVVGLFFAIFSPIIAKLIQMSISRRREFFADASAVAMTRQPSGLISALEKLHNDKEVLEAANRGTAHLYIINPFKLTPDAKSRFSSLFSTHPPVEERIAELQKMV